VSASPTQAFETSLTELRRWREATAMCLADLRRWAVVGRMIDEQAAARLAHLERRLATERLTIAFVAENSRGKSELINALFFANLGARLLPATAGRPILCPTEIEWDPSRPPSIRLLPIQTRDSTRALREYVMEIETWAEITLDPANPASLAPACEALCESIEIDAASAARLGFGAADSAASVRVPRWRYALINLPHPLLAGGVVVLDTAGRSTLAAEPELTFHRVPDAAAIVFMVSADSGTTKADQDLWEEHVAPVGGVQETCFIVLNKIDGLHETMGGENLVLTEIDRQVRATADALGVEPTRIYALSAKQGLAGKMQGDRDAIVKSRLYRLEQALSRGMSHHRRFAHATAVRAEVRGVLAEMRALISSRLAFAEEQLQHLLALQGKNQKLIETLARKAGVERGRIEQARATLMSLRTVHNVRADELERLLDPDVARAAGRQTRQAIAASTFSARIGESLDAFFSEAREKLVRAIELIEEAKVSMATAKRKFTEEYKIAIVDVGEFATARFTVELDRLEEHASAEFKGRSALLLRSRKALGALFYDNVAVNVIRIFEIADSEARTWLNGFIRPLDVQINAYQEQSNTRIEGMGRIQSAEVDLISKVGELQRLASEVAAQRDECESHRKRLMALLDVEREPSLA
jgi:hypothetical protein